MKERAEEMPTIEYIKKKIKERAKRKKGNILEQPWSSALWDRLQDLPGERHRTDQCRFKACDEECNPILKPTGLGATSSSTALKIQPAQVYQPKFHQPKFEASSFDFGLVTK